MKLLTILVFILLIVYADTTYSINEFLSDRAANILKILLRRNNLKD